MNDSGHRREREKPGIVPGSDNNPLRNIPSVDLILSTAEAGKLIQRSGRGVVKEALASVLARVRSQQAGPSLEAIIADLALALIELERPTLRRVINGSGVLIHTNLGRSPIDRSIWDDAGEIVTHYSNLELDLGESSRGHRDEHLEVVAQRLFGCEAAVLANNNAAATLLLLAAVAGGREVIVSRGELVEIGGSFRVPDVIQQGGATLREVGTTNRTRAADFTGAISKSTAAFLRVSRSNFEMVGFTESPDLDELVAAAHAASLPLLYDEGSGCVIDPARYGFRSRPTVRELLSRGVDAITCSTDKLIGATQGGLILGSKEIITRCRKHPLMRALRAGKESYAVIIGTLRAFLAGMEERRVPIYRMLSLSLEDLRARAATLARIEGVRAIDCESVLGGGTTPNEAIPSIGIEIDGPAEKVAARLILGDIPILGRIRNDRFSLDLRAIDPAEDELVMAAVRGLVEAG